jgi:hypothetical protein
MRATALKRALGLLAAGLICQAAAAAELILERTAVERLVQQSLFTDQGRYWLQRGACYAYLHKPAVTLAGGRVYLHAQLAAVLGVLAPNGNCAGVPIASKVTLSGRPVQAGGVVRLAELRLDDVGEPSVRALLQSGLVPNLPGAVEIDVAGAVRQMLKQPNVPYTSELESLHISAIAAEDNRLGVTFDFRLRAK